jgi:tRNA(Met) C34 N-acetyltransferase TmcA
VVVGDRSKDVIVHLHYIMSSMDVKQNKSVLWAYKNKLLGFTRYVTDGILDHENANISFSQSSKKTRTKD